jgi:hypothetical protein
VLGEQLRLALDDRERRAGGLHQADEEEVVHVEVQDALVRGQLPRVVPDQLVRQERHRHAIAGAPDDCVHRLLRAVGEAHAVAGELLDSRLGSDPPVADAAQDRVGDRGVVLEQAALGRRQAVVLRRTHDHAKQQLGERLPEPPGHVNGHPRLDHLVGGLAQQALGDHPAPVAHRQESALRDVGEVRGDVHRAVSHPDDEHALPAEPRRVVVVERVQLLAVEIARIRGVRPLGDVVVAVGDHQHVRPRALAAGELQLPAAGGQPLGALHPRSEANVLVQAEAVGVTLEVAADCVPTRVVGRARRHRMLGELRAGTARDQVQRAIGGGRPLLERPDAADPGPALVGRRVEARAVERAQRGQPRRPGSHDRDPQLPHRERGYPSVRASSAAPGRDPRSRPRPGS